MAWVGVVLGTFLSTSCTSCSCRASPEPRPRRKASWPVCPQRRWRWRWVSCLVVTAPPPPTSPPPLSSTHTHTLPVLLSPASPLQCPRRCFCWFCAWWVPSVVVLTPAGTLASLVILPFVWNVQVPEGEEKPANTECPVCQDEFSECIGSMVDVGRGWCAARLLGLMQPTCLVCLVLCRGWRGCRGAAIVPPPVSQGVVLASLAHRCGAR